MLFVVFVVWGFFKAFVQPQDLKRPVDFTIVVLEIVVTLHRIAILVWHCLSLRVVWRGDPPGGLVLVVLAVHLAPGRPNLHVTVLCATHRVVENRDVLGVVLVKVGFRILDRRRFGLMGGHYRACYPNFVFGFVFHLSYPCASAWLCGPIAVNMVTACASYLDLAGVQSYNIFVRPPPVEPVYCQAVFLDQS